MQTSFCAPLWPRLRSDARLDFFLRFLIHFYRFLVELDQIVVKEFGSFFVIGKINSQLASSKKHPTDKRRNDLVAPLKGESLKQWKVEIEKNVL
jgi:hypothetical protein